ncbi:MAG: SH3 domain-containing protein [Lachnospiraceae bacterium]|nr:SH3 domain-containing protein [Lachnospiraceae bacterium]
MDNFREWLSDNLRYIALILGILVVVLGLFFGVRAVVNRTDSNQSVDLATNSSVDTAAVTSAATRPTPTAAQKKESELVSKDGNLTDDAKKSITSVINTYYTALNTRSTDTVRALTDSLSAEDITSIETSETAYSDLSVIPKNGLSGDGKTAVAFVEYNYQNPDQAVSHPGLSWLYLQYDEKEAGYKIVVKASENEAIKNYVQTLTSEPDIAAVIERVQTEAAAADAAETGVPTDAGTTEDSQPAENSETQPETPNPDEAAAQAEAEAAAQAEAATQAEAAAQAEAEAAAQAEAEAAAQAEAEAAAQAEAELAALQAQLGENEYVILEACNVRKTAANDAEVVTVVDQGDVVTLIDADEGGWYHVRTESGEGYIGRRFINAQ